MLTPFSFRLALWGAGLALATIAGARAEEAKSGPAATASEYILGPDDQLKIWALGVEEISKEIVRVERSGRVDLPVIGPVQAAGLTVEQFRDRLRQKLAVEVREPRVSVDVVGFGSQPVSIMGAVGTPGIHQLHGRKTLAEVLALAGGLRADSGPKVKIVRRLDAGPIPLAKATPSEDGKYSVAEIGLKDFVDAKNPADNILIQPHDVISIPRAEMIYVMGEVRKPGGFTLSDRDRLSVLQALSMAEGLAPVSSPQSARIIRTPAGERSSRSEIPVDLKKILAGKAEDITLGPNDILYIPGSASKKIAMRSLEAAIQTVSGVIIWRGPRI